MTKLFEAAGHRNGLVRALWRVRPAGFRRPCTIRFRNGLGKQHEEDGFDAQDDARTPQADLRGEEAHALLRGASGDCNGADGTSVGAQPYRAPVLKSAQA
jgi:hypothetical protein